MPSALGTLAISSAGGGQEGYGPAAATASTSSPTTDNNSSIALQELNDQNNRLETALYNGAVRRSLDVARASTDANRLSAHPLSAATTLDGARDSLAIDPVTQDSPAHDFHAHTEVANAKNADIKEQLGLDAHTSTMADTSAAAPAANAPPQIARGNSLEDLEKTGAAEGPQIERSLSTDEKPTPPSQVNATATTTPLPTITSDPVTSSLTSSPESAHKDTAPALSITLLLPTGARHAFRITESYLTKRGASIPGTDDKGNKDVYSVSVYQIKELILREWKEEWGGETTVGPPAGEEVEEGRMRGKPSSPAAIRLIFFGRLLGDGDKVEDCRFNKTSTNVVHMTVRPQDVVDEEETERKRNLGSSGGRGSSRHQGGGEEATPGCRCVVM